MPVPTGGGSTVNVTGVLGVTANPLSRALAVTVCGPTGTLVHTKE
jgi:hypothetical protein